MTDGPWDPATAAEDPRTPQTELHRLAAEHPELRPQIAENPNTYQELLDWMAQLGDPEVSAALKRRAQERAKPEAAYPVAPQQPAPPQHAQPPGYSHPGPQAQQSSGSPTDNDQFFGMQSEPETDRRRGGKGALILMAGLLAVGAVAASLFLFLGSPFDGDDAETTAGQQPAEEEPEHSGADGLSDEPEEAAPSPTEDEEAEEAVRPAPDDAQEITAFATPSRNIQCEMTEDEALCTIAWHEFSAPDGCQGGTTLRVSEDGAEEACETQVEDQPVSLDYEAAATNGDFACESTEEGVECWSTSTGEGFIIAAAEYELFD